MISPCVNICEIRDNVCVGYFRTLEQIACWTEYTEQQRQQIIQTNADKVFMDTHESSKLE
jgi:predicted Fe-S protein YdhL (DUF1289 family)